MRKRFGPPAAILLSLIADFAAAQSPDEHAAHHPQEPDAAVSDPASMQTSTMPMSAPPAGELGQMQEMMREMLQPPRKELYPTLIALPEMPPDQRASVEQAANERMTSGAAQMSQAFDRLISASGDNDYGAMQSAVGEIREALGRFDSGLAANRALHEGQSPQTIATDWFKKQLNIAPPAADAAATGPFGWSWSHWTGMTLIAGFGMALLMLNVWRTRRTTQVLAKLAAAPAPPLSPGGSSPISKEPSAFAPRLPENCAPPPPLPLPIAAPATPPSAAVRQVGDVEVNRVWKGELAVAQVFQETPEIKTFRLVNPDGGAIPFRHRPGQYLCVFVNSDSKVVRRCYTIASSPTRPDYIELSIKREGKGLVSALLHAQLKPGDRLLVEAAKGYFTFTGSEADSIVLISGGVGITPMMSVIRCLTDQSWAGDIYLLHCARSTAEFCFRDELEFLQRKHPNLHIVASLTRSEGEIWMGPTGRLTADLIRECVPSIERRRVHLCGPPPMMDFVKKALDELGVPKAQIKTEAFGPAAKPTVPPAVASTSMTAPAPAAPIPPEAVSGSVFFARSGKTALLPPGKTVLEAAEDIGVFIESACRSGTCGSCKVKLLKGSVTMEVEDALEPGDKQKGVILACQAKSAGAVEVDA
ncbi:MAG TPA: hypothetical protein DDZ68_11610 [Parvularcula sp.]|nr:hypothetical protein [Parvularcula sp.]